MNKSKKMLTGFILTAAVILAAAVLPAGFRSGDSRIYSGVPDVISTRTQNEKCTLTVVANSGGNQGSGSLCPQCDQNV